MKIWMISSTRMLKHVVIAPLLMIIKSALISREPFYKQMLSFKT